MFFTPCPARTIIIVRTTLTVQITLGVSHRVSHSGKHIKTMERSPPVVQYPVRQQRPDEVTLPALCLVQYQHKIAGVVEER